MTEEFPRARAQADAVLKVAELCSLAVSRTGTDGMAVSLLDSWGHLEPVLQTDAVAEKVSGTQFTLGEGPGFDAASSGVPVLTADLRADDSTRRWPGFAPETVALGVASVHAFPLGSAGVRLGSALLYRHEPGDLEERQVHQAEAISALLALTLVDPDHVAALSAELRMVVHQAAGMVMMQTGGSIIDALVLLRATAFSEDVPVTGLAADVVAGRRRFTSMQRPGGTP